MAKGFGNYRGGRGRRPRVNFLLNENIRYQKLQVIVGEGDNLGVLPTKEALQIAEEKELDLFIISEKPEIPIAKIMDYGKYKFEQSKKEKTQKKNSATNETKEIKMRYNIDIGDYNTRLNHAKKFLGQGKRVKLNITLRGREMQHKNLAKDLGERFLNDLMNEGYADGVPDRMMGRSIIVYIQPGPDKARIKKAEEEKKREEENAEDGSELQNS